MIDTKTPKPKTTMSATVFSTSAEHQRAERQDRRHPQTYEHSLVPVDEEPQVDGEQERQPCSSDDQGFGFAIVGHGSELRWRDRRREGATFAAFVGGRSPVRRVRMQATRKTRLCAQREREDRSERRIWSAPPWGSAPDPHPLAQVTRTGTFSAAITDLLPDADPGRARGARHPVPPLRRYYDHAGRVLRSRAVLLCANTHKCRRSLRRGAPVNGTTMRSSTRQHPSRSRTGFTNGGDDAVRRILVARVVSPVVRGALQDPRPPREVRAPGRARQAMRLRHLSSRTVDAYLGWMRRYYEFHGRCAESGGPLARRIMMLAFPLRRPARVLPCSARDTDNPQPSSRIRQTCLIRRTTWPCRGSHR